eukprot:CAMPEP_0117444960 /NCGR_PEP_ID=MMETSP0759-20121206/5533_1 /TAXON_ID=63605 /ORGANISM="Percolomonas cosmopolitus, Strain WS" /LENGTH=423 /DNA_ID=CAMNT_0005237089 /DNA_START=71 /DNA_END=1339 /DNA_ORIENTATION=-
MPYCVMLSAAQFIVPGYTGATLLANILPTLVIKLTAPFFMHYVPYNTRILIVTFASFASFFLVAWGPHVALKLFGVVLASIGAGLGEITFLAMLSFYDANCVSAWSAGTGGAGIAGSLSFLLLNAVIHIDPKWSLMIIDSIVPFMLVVVFVILTGRHNAGRSCYGFGWRVKGAIDADGFEGCDADEDVDTLYDVEEVDHEIPAPALNGGVNSNGTISVTMGGASDDAMSGSSWGGLSVRGVAGSKSSLYTHTPHNKQSQSTKSYASLNTSTITTPNSLPDVSESDSLLQKSEAPPYSELDEELSKSVFPPGATIPGEGRTSEYQQLGDDENEDALINGKLRPLSIKERVSQLFPLLRYMIPLFVVYYSEYVINTGIAPAIRFQKGWIHPDDDYKYYTFCYAVGVLISRSSVNILPVRHVAGLW